MPTNVPNEPGFYFAKSGNFKWFNLLVRVEGEVPFLHLTAWHLVADKLIKMESIDEIAEFSSRIKHPEEQK